MAPAIDMHSIPCRYLLIFLLLASGVTISGCAVVDSSVHDHHDRRGTLSSAIKNGTTAGGSHHSGHYDRHDQNSFIDVLVAGRIDTGVDPAGSEPAFGDAEAARISDHTEGSVSICQSTSLVTSKQVKKINRLSMQLDGRGDDGGFSFKLAYTNFDFEADWEYAANLKNPWALDLGFDYRYYFADNRSLLFQPYIGAGFAYGAMYWSYNQAIVDSQTGERITNDSLDYIRLAALIGVEMRMSRSFRIGVDLQQDITYHSVTTNRGFINDVFEDFGSTICGVRAIFIF